MKLQFKMNWPSFSFSSNKSMFAYFIDIYCIYNFFDFFLIFLTLFVSVYSRNSRCDHVGIEQSSNRTFFMFVMSRLSFSF